MERHQQPPRDRVHNPNYPTNPSPTKATAYPSFSQPGPTQPPFDPFQRSTGRRDPFIPSFAPKQRDPPPDAHPLPDPRLVEPHFPVPPPRSPFRASQTYRTDRRNSLGTSFRNAIHDPPPPPPPPNIGLFGRPMPPPSPIHRQHSSSLGNHTQDSTRLPRNDPPIKSRTPRQSMSIHNLVESDSQPSTKPAAWSPLPGSAPMNERPRTRPGSPGPSFGLRGGDTGSQIYSPASRRDPETTRIQEPNGFPGMTFTDTQAKGGERSGNPIHGFSRLLQPFHHSPGPPPEPHPQRPFSQPAEPDILQREIRRQDPHPSSLDNAPPGTFGRIRDRASSDLDAKRSSMYTEPLPHPLQEPTFGRIENGSGPMFGNNRLSLYEDRAPFPSRRDIPPEDADYGRNGHAPGEPAFNSRRGNGISKYEDPAAHEPRYPMYGPPGPHGYDLSPELERRPQRTPPSVDPVLHQSIEDIRRPFMSMHNDQIRRYDGGSPLPQAVQGAQSQPAGSGRDPGIKSEFGRMFSGLGSGVGSTPQPNGTSTPNRRSPLDERKPADKPSRRDANHTSSRGGRRTKRPNDDNRMNAQGGDAKLTSAALSKVPKRNRYIQPPVPQHHHHHPAVPHHHHHHHHHHHKPEEDEAANGKPSSGRPDAFRFPESTASAAVPHHHHHHHHHPHTHVPHHHHHHAPKPKPPPVPVMTITNSPLIQSVSHLPRQHFGSQLYSPKAVIPAASTTTIDSTHKIDTSPNPLPRFERSKANSTFTIRVPRKYLTNEARQTVCISRRLWGTSVYTDDSDPLAAAIHSGYIRGAWDEGVDVEMLLGLDAVRPEDKKESKDLDAYRTLDAPPAPNEGGPVVPPGDRDAHITLLVLPPLEKYGTAVWHGVKSRAWGGNHDGMSFKVEKVEWVDGVGDSGRIAAKRRVEQEMRDAMTKKLKTTVGKVGSVSASAPSSRGRSRVGSGVVTPKMVQAVA